MSSDADAFSDHKLSSWNDFVCAAWTYVIILHVHSRVLQVRGYLFPNLQILIITILEMQV